MHRKHTEERIELVGRQLRGLGAVCFQGKTPFWSWKSGLHGKDCHVLGPRDDVLDLWRTCCFRKCLQSSARFTHCCSDPPGVAELAAAVHGHRPAPGLSSTLGQGRLCWCNVWGMEQGSSSPVSTCRCTQGNWFGGPSPSPPALGPYCQVIPCTDSS